MKRIAAIVPNILGTSPGQRIRIESWAQHLQQYGWTVDFYPFEDALLHEVLYKPGRVFTKASRLMACYLRQLRLAVRGVPCDVLLIYREASLIGPAVIERVAARLKVPIVYDVDDPVFISYRSPANGRFSFLKCSRKTHTLFRISNHIVAINDLIGNYAAEFNPSVSIVPNFVDTDRYSPVTKPESDIVRLVWTGSLSTLQNLASIVEPLKRLQARYQAPLRIIGVGQADMPGVELEIRRWSADTEALELQQCDIGLVPLVDLPWNRWKFFLKTVQYMAAGLPVVAQRMGSNSEVIQDGVNGFVVETQHEWYERLRLLIEDAGLRRQMGIAARKTAVERFSLQSQMARVAAIFDRVLQRSIESRSSSNVEV